MTQRYASEAARARMAEGTCPECGQAPEKHLVSSAFWLPRHCDLTRSGVAARIAAFQQDVAEATASDPAVGAAQRAWIEIVHNDAAFDLNDFECMELVNAAREALKPIRDLHTKAPLYNLVQDCEICSSEDDAVNEQHEQFEGPDGDFLCGSVVVAHSCNHCTTERTCGCYEPVDWPCATAKLVYSTGEL